MKIKKTRIYSTLRGAYHGFKDYKKSPSPNTKSQKGQLKIDQDSKHLCTGCGACYNACPVNAITMEYNKEGFLVPIINEEKCIHCGKCQKVCPLIHMPQSNTLKPKCYAVKASDQIRKKSSSGGVFTLLAEYILSEKGYVCGAVLTDHFDVEFTIISNKKDLDALRGSKYVQSNTKTIFTEIKKLLDNNKKVLFTGCPCQVAGLYTFLNKEYPNLYTADLVCHGAPPLKVFQKYIDEYYQQENIESFHFRTKKFGHDSTVQTIKLKNGKMVDQFIDFDPYEIIMHKGIAANDCCISCPFAETPRQGDITFGDFWGLKQHYPQLTDELGTSVLLVNNEKGDELLNNISKKAKMVEEVPFDIARRHNRFGKTMTVPLKERRQFFRMIDGQTLEKSLNYALNRRFDVGIIGLWYGRNYGSLVTYYALHQVLTELFHLSVLMIENPLRRPVEEDSPTHPDHLANRFYDVSKFYSISDLQHLNNYCDTFLVGSDQLWNLALSRPYNQTYFLGFADDSKKKISYATSFAVPYDGSDKEIEISKHNLKRFDHISVRDQLSSDILKDTFGITNVQQTCDPSFLCPIEEYQKLMDLTDEKEDGEYILAYFLDTNAEIGKLLQNLVKEKKCKVVIILNALLDTYEADKKKLQIENSDHIIIKSLVSLPTWLWYLQHAKAIVTDSFHGTIFSLIFEKPFLTKINYLRGAARFHSLLEPLNLDRKLVEEYDEIISQLPTINDINYKDVNNKLRKIKKESMDWLKNALYSPKKEKSYKIYDKS